MNLRNLANLYDDSRNHHTITNHNAIPVRGIHGRGMDFNGLDAYLDCGNHSSLNITDALTIEAWVKCSDPTGNYMQIVSGNEANFQRQLRYYTTTGRLMGRLIFTTSGAVEIIGNTITNANVWYHVVATYDSANVKIFVNSVSDATPIAVADTIATQTVETFIGKRSDGLFFNGIIDNVRIYNYALSADTIKLHYRQQSPYYQEEAPTIIL